MFVKTKRTHSSCDMHPMTNDEELPLPALRLRQAREASGFRSANAAAIRFGWSVHTYGQHENGTRGLARAAAKYAKAYKVSEGWLLTGEGVGPGAGRDYNRDIAKLRLIQPDIAEMIDRELDYGLSRPEAGETVPGRRKQ